MNVKDLSEELERLGISKDLYSLMSGGAPNEKLCLVYDGVWKIYYSERGKQTGEKIFSNEEDACEAFLRKMTRYSKLRQAKLRHFSVLFLLAIFLLCGCAPSEDERKEYIRQGQENAVAYINEKYGFEAEIEEVKLHYVDTSPIPSFTIKFDGEATVTMKYCGRIFDVVVRADEKNSDGKDDYQYEDIVSVFLMELEKETNSHYDYKKSFLFSCEDELGYRDFAAKSMSEYSYFSGDIAWSYSDIQCEHAKELKDSIYFSKGSTYYTLYTAKQEEDYFYYTFDEYGRMTNETVSLSKHITDPSMFADAADDFEGEVQYSDSITISNDADHSVIYVKAEAFFPEFQDRFDIDNPSILYESEIGGDGERCCSEYIEIEISDVYDTSGIHYKKIVPGRDEVTLCYLKDKVI